MWWLRRTSCPSLTEGANKDLSKGRKLRVRASQETDCRLKGWRRDMAAGIGSVPSSMKKKRATRTWGALGHPGGDLQSQLDVPGGRRRQGQSSVAAG